jgi:SAM-dependent methyltransferase
MKECTKAFVRRSGDINFAARYFVGNGIDIGGAPDPLSLYAQFFPRMGRVRIWDVNDGDAQSMPGVGDASFDFVHSTHCLEHLVDPLVGLQNWFRILKPGGHLVVIVPDEDLYEQGVFPSTYNSDHKWTFTISKTRSWSAKSRNLIDLIGALGEAADLRKIECLDSTYLYGLPRFDQTLTPVGEAGIELVVRKRLPDELAHGGRLPSADGKFVPGAERLLRGF